MPTIHIDKEALLEHLGGQFDTAQFRELCFEFGIELEEDSSELETFAPGDRAEFKIDIPANRYDLLCFEGLSRALGVFLGREEAPKYAVVPVAKPQRITVAKECAQVRPYVVGAILRGVTFTKDRYDSFIKLQDKLHANICDERKLVSIGTHDLDTIQGPFTYEALKPEEIKFVPLNQTELMDGHQVMEFYEGDGHIENYLDIIRESPVYPVVYDANRTVMSLPPLINSNHSKITLDTKNVLIEITATDLTKANVVLNIVVTMFSAYCEKPFTVEPMEVVYPDGKSVVYPDLEPVALKTTGKYLNGLIGIQKSSGEIVELLKKMSLAATAEGDEITVLAPPTRPDIMQECDVAEDLAIAFGYNNIPRVQSNEATVGVPLPLNKLSDIVRKEIAMAGWTEVLTLSLCSHKEGYELLRLEDKGDEAVVMKNPETLSNEMCRTLLLPGLLKTVHANRMHANPLKLFEVSDVVVKDGSLERGARNKRHACAIYSSDESKFEIVQGLLDTLMQSLNVVRARATAGYHLVEAENHPMYLPGRAANIVYTDDEGHAVPLGTIGILHPEVLTNFKLKYPISTFEINIEPFL
ncbi:phenylalanine--tRNA ligase subunit beta [Coemansia javaensis]|uniref:phenylalanine--tRNA ligase n=1 Tax=Coemansia javaensis TaxID=2761396 RepID=A0A9W8HIP0_9FUNG|nr:phenylalanine--tRNA ligase subunit beta [Coemansia javaensis]